MATSNKEYISIEGTEYPFTTEEFKKILNIIKHTFSHAEEDINREDELKQLDVLLKQLDN